MNTNGLGRMYGLLSVRERLPMLLAAGARGDDIEVRRLEEAASIRTMQFSDYLWPSLKLNVMTLIYLTEQLDTLACYWHAQWRLDDPDNPKTEDWQFVTDASGHFFNSNAEAWRLFCAELHIDPGHLAAGNYHGWLLGFCSERMPTPNVDALKRRLQEKGKELICAESLLASWQELWKQKNPGGAYKK
jgi:hypothetical protein